MKQSIHDCCRMRAGSLPHPPQMPAESCWQVRTPRWDLLVCLSGRTIVAVPLTHRRFKGQPFDMLTRWLWSETPGRLNLREV